MSRTIWVDSIELEAAWVGPPRTEPPVGAELVFLHEGLGSITQWRETPAAIADASGRAALVYARQGYGKSTPVAVPRPLTYMHDEAARLPAIVAAEDISAPILIGHSDGASIAIIAAGSPETITAALKPRALVLIAPHVFVEDISISSIAKAAGAYRTTDLRAKLARHHADVDGAFWGWNRAWLDLEFRKWNLEKFLPWISVPVLIVQGDADEYGTLAQADAIMRRVAGPCETFVVAGAGHSPFRDQPDAVHARIVEFIRKHS